MILFKRAALLLGTALIMMNAWAYDPKESVVTGHELPKELQSVGVDEHLGATLDRGLMFTDDKGVTAPLGQFLSSDRPTLMAMVYYSCPSLCSVHLNALTEQMKQLDWNVGKQFNVVAVSMQHTETPDLAAKKKHNYLAAYGRMETADGWRFLVGNEASVKALAAQLGFRFHWMEDKKEFAHAAVAYVITPEGKISRYLHGIQPDVNTLKMSLLEASNGRIGSMVEQVLMFCFKFDPSKSKYTLYAWNVMRIGAILMVLLLAVILLPLWWREQMRNRMRT